MLLHNQNEKKLVKNVVLTQETESQLWNFSATVKLYRTINSSWNPQMFIGQIKITSALQTINAMVVFEAHILTLDSANLIGKMTYVLLQSYVVHF